MLGLAGVGLLLQIEAVRRPLGLLGAAYLLWLARASWKDAEAADGRLPAGRPERSGSPLMAGVALLLSNPQNIAFWAAIGSAVSSVGVSQPTAADHAVFFAGFMAASLGWAFLCAAMVAQMLARASATWVRWTYRLCALCFATLSIWSVHVLLVAQSARPGVG